MKDTRAFESDSPGFDVFLCHNGDDKVEVRRLADDLIGRGLVPWLDERELRPGTSWQSALGAQIANVNSAAVCVGKSGIGPWQNQEIQSLLSQFVRRNCPVIPVVLPSADTTPALPWTLENIQWVDFRSPQPDPLDQLVWGITGTRPDRTGVEPPSRPPWPASASPLLSRKDKQVIEIRLPGDLRNFTAEDKQQLLRSLNDLLDIADIKLTREPLAGSVRLLLELSAEDADRLYTAVKRGDLTPLGITDARLYTALPTPPAAQERSELIALLDDVHRQWVNGVLKHSLYNEVLISLGKRPIQDAVEPRWNQRVVLTGGRQELLRYERNIATLFDATGSLLILGEPGSGKTTTLLQLASELIERARNDAKERVPVVLNLSSWKKGQALADWILSELGTKYQVSSKAARFWLDSDYLALLLDGLDEVHIRLQPDCVAAINTFIETARPSGVVVCCRLTEYEWLPTRLHLNGAICLEPLTADEVNGFLAGGGEQFAGLQRALSRDPVLEELSRTPLMLSIMSLAYQNREIEGGVVPFEGKAIAVRRDDIFALYIDRMLERKRTSTSSFEKSRIIRSLSWLAQEMSEHSQSVFMVEELQPSWLPLLGERMFYGILVALVMGLLLMPIVALASGEWSVAAAFAGLTALAILAVGWPVSHLKSFIYSAGSVLCSTVILVSYLLLSSLSEVLAGPAKQWLELFTILFLPVLLLAPVWFVARIMVDSLSRVALKPGLWRAQSDAPHHRRVAPNDGIVRSAKRAAMAFSIAFALGLALAVGLVREIDQEFAVGGGALGLGLGLIVGLNRGGSAVLKHYVIRLILVLRGYIPMRLVALLDQSANLILLKKVGGGYVFVHRLLLDYFAELSRVRPGELRLR